MYIPMLEVQELAATGGLSNWAGNGSILIVSALFSRLDIIIFWSPTSPVAGAFKSEA